MERNFECRGRSGVDKKVDNIRERGGVGRTKGDVCLVVAAKLGGWVVRVRREFQED